MRLADTTLLGPMDMWARFGCGKTKPTDATLLGPMDMTRCTLWTRCFGLRAHALSGLAPVAVRNARGGGGTPAGKPALSRRRTPVAVSNALGRSDARRKADVKLAAEPVAVRNLRGRARRRRISDAALAMPRKYPATAAVLPSLPSLFRDWHRFASAMRAGSRMPAGRLTVRRRRSPVPSAMRADGRIPAGKLTLGPRRRPVPSAMRAGSPSARPCACDRAVRAASSCCGPYPPRGTICTV